MRTYRGATTAFTNISSRSRKKTRKQTMLLPGKHNTGLMNPNVSYQCAGQHAKQQQCEPAAQQQQAYLLAQSALVAQ
jgi:hypothetical protein